jgi:hypothetical protein
MTVLAVRHSSDLTPRAKSTSPQPQSRAQSPARRVEGDSRPHAMSSQGLVLRNRSSMEDDLRGLDSRGGPRGVKRLWAAMSDGGESDDEPGPKRDRLFEELCDLQSVNRSNDQPTEPHDAEEENTALNTSEWHSELGRSGRSKSQQQVNTATNMERCDRGCYPSSMASASSYQSPGEERRGLKDQEGGAPPAK